MAIVVGAALLVLCIAPLGFGIFHLRAFGVAAHVRSCRLGFGMLLQQAAA